jgi:antitoxin (DNA-binding transcriptional repressor) of toxin-antitoxin stability system
MIRENTLTEEGRPSAKLVPVSWVSSSLRANGAWLSTNLTEEGTAVTVSD